MAHQFESNNQAGQSVSAELLIERTLQDLLMYTDQTNITQVRSFELNLDPNAKRNDEAEKIPTEAMFVTSGTRLNGDYLEFFENEPVRFDFDVEDKDHALRLSNITASCFDYQCAFPSVEIPH